MGQGFVHLHTHSEYSLLDGASRVEDLAVKAARLGMSALALTDHGVMYGTVPFVKACQDVGVKPIVGCEVYITQGPRDDRTQGNTQKLNHLVLLAENETGYRNLMQIVSRAFLEGFYYRPRVDAELLAQHKDGLIAMSSCLKGEVPRRLIDGDYENARRIALEYRDLFGADNFFLEVMNHGIPDQARANEGLRRLAEETGIRLVATNDSHYTDEGDHEAQDILLCIGTGSTIEEADRLRFSSDQFFFKSPVEMAAALPDFPDALDTTVDIAERCNVGFEFGTLRLPHYDVPEGHTLDSYLRTLVDEGLARRYGGGIAVVTAGRAGPAEGDGSPDATTPPEAARRRADSELEVITSKGLSGYFLVVSDFVNRAREMGVMVGPGRGSAAGSIVAYALGITSLDPIEHGLLFERFLNPERMSMPDIDIDFDDEKRSSVIAYVREKYGEDHVAQIITFSKMKARAAIRDAARVLNEPYGVGDRLAKQIVEVGDAEREKIKREYAGSLISYSLQMNPELREEYETRDDAKRILDAAKRIEGLSRTDSIHAAGVVISPQPLTTYVPLQRKSDNGKTEAETVTQYDMNAVAELGLLKMDFLGLKTLTVITKTIEMIRRTREIDIDIDTIPFDDPETFELFRAADTVGVFQVESAGMRRLLTALGPTSFAEIVALIALFRPGPLGSGMADDFVNRKHGRNKVQFPHPMLEEILAETYGTIVYQEQVMQIAQIMGGFTPGEADDLRKAMGKKKADVMAEQKEKFVRGAVAAGVTEKLAAKVFDDIEYFAGYGFNKSHSAAYAVISYQTAYLKSHYRPEFMAALLTSIMSNKDDVLKYVNDCKAAQIPVLPPDVNESGTEFAVVDGRIRFALTAIRNVGLGLAESIVTERDKTRRFSSIFDFCSRVDPGLLNKRALESLVKAGAFDSCGHTRKHNLAVFEQACDGGAQRQRDAESGQVSIFDLGEEHDIDMGDVEPPADPTELERDDLLAFEKEMLGVYVSDHPLTGLEEALRRATDYSISDFKETADQTIGWIAGIASEVKKKATKRGDLMLTLRLEDLEGSIEVTVFPKTYQECGALCVDDALLRIKAKLDERDEGHPIALAQEIEALSTDADTYPARGPLRIHVKGDDVDAGTIDTLKSTLTRFVGDIDVFLHVLHDDTIEVFRLGPAYRVDATEKLLAAVNELLGYEACALG